MAALLVFVGLNAVFMGVVAFSGEVDRTNRLIALAIFIPLVLCTLMFAVGLYTALFAKRISGRRWARVNRELGAMGFRDATASEIQDTLGLPVQLLAPYMLALQRGGGIDHVRVGQVDGHEVRAFNVRIRGGGWIDVPAVALRVHASLTQTVIRPSRGPMPPRPDMKRAWFEHEQFNRSVAVFSVDPFFASAMVDPRMMDWLRTNIHQTTIELADHWVVAWDMPHQRFGRGPQELIDFLIGFDERIPRSVPSLFPERLSRMRWHHAEQRE
jgi:hypothetical protein